jgi:hypothetical protein
MWIEACSKPRGRSFCKPILTIFRAQHAESNMNVKKPIKRRDAQGHIDPKYARELLEKGRETKNDDNSPEANHACLKGASSHDELAEELGEAFVQAVTSGEESEGDRHERVTPEENGGPFVETSANEEYAVGTDESNIAEATREPLPRTSKAVP